MIEAGWQAGIHSEVAATATASVAWCVMPTGPIWLTFGIIVAESFNIPLDEVVVLVGGIGGRAGWIAEQELERDADGSVGRKNGKQEATSNESARHKVAREHS